MPPFPLPISLDHPVHSGQLVGMSSVRPVARSRDARINLKGETMITTTHSVKLSDVGPVDVAADVTVDEYGEGRPFLLLHGGGGPDSVSGFAELLASTHDARVIRPTHP